MFCRDRADFDIAVSLLFYGHPWSPSAIKVCMQLDAPVGEEIVPSCTKAIIFWKSFEWNEAASAYEPRVGSRELDRLERTEFQRAFFRSEMLNLSQEQAALPTQGVAELLWALDPISVVARYSAAGTDKSVERQGGKSVAMDALVDLMRKLGKESKPITAPSLTMGR